MARLSQLPNATRSAKAQAMLALLAGGLLRIYNGAMPADGNAAPAGVLLAEFELADPVGVEVNGVITFTLPDPVLAVASGTASVGALFTAGGVRVANFNVGPADGDGFVLELDLPTLNAGTSEVEITAFSWNEAATGE